MERSKVEVTVELWCNEKSFRFISEGTKRFPLKQRIFLSLLKIIPVALSSSCVDNANSTNSLAIPTSVKNDWVFDVNGKLIICPLLRDKNNSIVEYLGIPQFHPPAYDYVQGIVRLKQDTSGNYVFCDVERDNEF
ncbi:MAG TPA: hypothetical protein DCL61_06920 [Cyanobacteria bacterium UBA12227]|nr:hypothetical protein [Cyanobacteria bacterium UBA12227]